jgi:hypothetical protein
MSAKSQKNRRKPGPVPRHGGYSLLTTGRLPERRRYIAPYLTAVREGLISDLAKSEEDLSTGQRVLIDRVVTFLGVVRLIEEHARDNGLLDQRGRLKGGIGTGNYLSFNRHIKDCLALLGLNKHKADEALTIQDVIREFDSRKVGGGATANMEEAEKTQPGATSREIQSRGDTAEE